MFSVKMYCSSQNIRHKLQYKETDFFFPSVFDKVKVLSAKHRGTNSLSILTCFGSQKAGLRGSLGSCNFSKYFKVFSQSCN